MTLVSLQKRGPRHEHFQWTKNLESEATALASLKMEQTRWLLKLHILTGSGT